MSYTKTSLENLHAKAAADYKSTRKFLKTLRKAQPQALDKLFHDRHTLEFSQIDCLECANCCKSISPAMYNSDVRRIAKTLKMKESVLIDQYMRLDEEGEYVFRSSPCPFLQENNYCSIYNSRPKACREYPHTDRKRMYQILDLTARNTKTCPAVFNIISFLKER